MENSPSAEKEGRRPNRAYFKGGQPLSLLARTPPNAAWLAKYGLAWSLSSGKIGPCAIARLVDDICLFVPPRPQTTAIDGLAYSASIHNQCGHRVPILNNDFMLPDPIAGPSDDFLVASMLVGDWAALNKLIDRYDRLVRYTILRTARQQCAHDPQLLESVASATWAGFVQSLQRHPDQRPKSVRAYLAAIAKNQVVSALRASATLDAARLPLDDGGAPLIAATLEEPIDTLSRLELLETLRICLMELSDDDRILAGQLTAITERRWQDAAAALGISESTIRSRWKRTLERLRSCLQAKTGLSFAPETPEGDS